MMGIRMMMMMMMIQGYAHDELKPGSMAVEIVENSAETKVDKEVGNPVGGYNLE